MALLDTSVVLANTPGTRAALLAASGDFTVSVVSVAEIVQGPLFARTPEQRRHRDAQDVSHLDGLLHIVDVV